MTRIRRRIGWLFAGSVALSIACAHDPTARKVDSVEVRAAIEAVNEQFAAALRRGDAAALAALFTEDGEVISPTAKGFINGRAALEAYYADRLRTARFLDSVITTIAVQVDGDLAWTTGTSRFVIQVGDAPPVTRTGRYLAALKRGSDGRWRYRVDAVIPDPAG